ncbi:hypothetical protein BLOT_002171 [Blomia tropicalis]|nr:hypothetical protein BLOT_002171 [Blomia tropicalis]
MMKNVTPIDQISPLNASYGLCSNICGHSNGNVPQNVELSRTRLELRSKLSLAKPKSDILATHFSDSKILSGLISRCAVYNVPCR